MPRKRSYDRADVLERAMLLFWEHGYESASIQLLTEAMGINRFSLYAAFGDKQGLFLEALDLYNHRVVGAMVSDLEVPEPDLTSIEAYFERFFDNIQGPPGTLGCLVVVAGAERARTDVETALRVQRHRKRLQRGFERALEGGILLGQVRPAVEPARRASALTLLAQGLALQARTGVPQAFLRESVAVALEDIRSPAEAVCRTSGPRWCAPPRRWTPSGGGHCWCRRRTPTADWRAGRPTTA